MERRGGEAGAAFIADLYAEAGVLGNISGRDYRGLLEALMSGVTVRPKYGTHPRLSILGPIEARLTHFDRVIIGEVNENIWPQAVTADPWMSRPMKREFGFPLPERTVGVGAYDFSQLLANEEDLFNPCGTGYGNADGKITVVDASGNRSQSFKYSDGQPGR